MKIAFRYIPTEKAMVNAHAFRVPGAHSSRGPQQAGFSLDGVKKPHKLVVIALIDAAPQYVQSSL